jgi:hypothetical protein
MLVLMQHAQEQEFKRNKMDSKKMKNKLDLFPGSNMWVFWRGGEEKITKQQHGCSTKHG